jgi:phosphomannomutase
MTPDPKLRARVRAWIEDDPDARDRRELQALLDAGEQDELASRFAGTLHFGTAGLRGPVGAGPMRMNRAVVARATAGLCSRLGDALPDARERGLCIGFDARHRSAEMAEEAAAVAAGAGFRVQLFDRPVPTPVLAFALLDRKAAGAVMVTASHNPPRDNGYKVYWHNGAQIIAPEDEHIAAEMDAVGSLRELPRVDAARREAQGMQETLGDALEARYLEAVAELVGTLPQDAGSLQVAYTALHGVGQRTLMAALEQAGFERVEAVAEQGEPDPDFPTVSFPNPEEPGAMDRVMALGEATGADVVLANDPDADRLAVAARDESRKLVAFTGNELGVLLEDHLLRSRPGPDALVVTSIVSSPMAAAVAAAHGAMHESVLTGFKWICNRAMQLESERGARFVFGFEEALGYTAGTAVRDKDGISTAVLVCAMAAAARREGKSLHGLLEELFRRHGVYLSGQVSVRIEGADSDAKRTALMAGLRKRPPREIGGLAVEHTRDLMDDPALPASDALFYALTGGHRVAVRPSGTEPKIKLYVDVREPVSDGEPLDAARSRARAAFESLREAGAAMLAGD